MHPAPLTLPAPNTVLHGDSLDVLRTLPARSVDAVITDPPYCSGGRQAPQGGLILDPFTGSGTTGEAAVLEGHTFLGIEKDGEYATDAQQRVHRAASPLPASEPIAV